MSDVRDGAFDEFLDALEEGDGYYLECSNGHGLLPPRRVCPHCGDRELTRRPLPATGEIVTHTSVAVPTPQFDDDAPYVTAIASFGPVRITGIVADADRTDVEIGQPVAVDVEANATTGERTITFRLQ
ncbi:OB-fold domain-containing protein [Natronolimnohabitans sp. A-GB9]|uniref:Zn-ribbon domain-containing OB-fold protein n=1 Tax=Natronolimnohabitans sp. A-GB9 TaxID=3069757 RepID=UPI0027B357B4|nr:OB-fold domain-containing protein [Natronolimnohabitans sp. A-GB9]MDQ2051799.1 OB-fold domain-containing protein [Natronolimnohabitans sp. A-GB9]